MTKKKSTCFGGLAKANASYFFPVLITDINSHITQHIVRICVYGLQNEKS